MLSEQLDGFTTNLYENAFFIFQKDSKLRNNLYIVKMMGVDPIVLMLSIVLAGNYIFAMSKIYSNSIYFLN